LVTGGGRGIGRVIAQTLASAGLKVAVLARSADQLAETVSMIQQAGGQSHAFPADVTDPGAVSRAIEDIERLYGPVDLLVNNAGALDKLGPFAESDATDWWRVMEVNLRGPMLFSRAVLPGMIARHRGRIVNIISGAAANAFTYFSAYVASKTALARFSEVLAAEVKPHGVSVFPMEPGTVRTTMSEYSLNSEEGQKWIPWFRRIFDEGLNVPPERAAQRVLSLASGKYDALSGRILPMAEDLDFLLANAAEIAEKNHYSLRLGRLGPESPSSSVRLIRSEGERSRDPR
jgi:NAD(P)-dependent dehydrogenase (short-subunit alcohol dehydrogenase family)